MSCVLVFFQFIRALDCKCWCWDPDPQNKRWLTENVLIIHVNLFQVIYQVKIPDVLKMWEFSAFQFWVKLKTLDILYTEWFIDLVWVGLLDFGWRVSLAPLQLRWLTSWPSPSIAPDRPSSPRSSLRSSPELLPCKSLHLFISHFIPPLFCRSLFICRFSSSVTPLTFESSLCLSYKRFPHFFFF